ncbi:MAG: addiction module protein [Geitlerinemataceae cyanobacterium]
MQSLARLISEAKLLTDAYKATLIGEVFESMADPSEFDALDRQVQIARDRLTELENGQVQSILGDIALAQIHRDPDYWKSRLGSS